MRPDFASVVLHEPTSDNRRMVQTMKSFSTPPAPRGLARVATLLPLLVLLLLISPASSAAAETLQSSLRASTWYAWEEAGRACVSDRAGEIESCWTMAPGGRLTDLTEIGAGWLAAGYEHGGEDTDVFVLAGGVREPERLPKLPTREALRGSPRLVVDDARLLGLVWLEGDSQPVLELRAAEWLGSAWGAR